MAEIKTLRNYAFRRTLIALLSVMFVVLLGGYRWHIQTTNNKLKDRTAPLQELTNTLLSQSGSNDDSLIRSSIMQREAQISGLDLTPSVSNHLRGYISNLYTVAGAFDAAKASLPQTNDREYMFDRGTINLLQTNSLLSGDVLALYSGRETIHEAIRYLSGAVAGTINETKKQMSSHNLSVALASQIGVEVLLCTKSYNALAIGWSSISSMLSGLEISYQTQLNTIGNLTTNNESIMACINEYRTILANNITEINTNKPLVEKLTALSLSRQRAYGGDPLQCHLGTDLYDDIVTVREYEKEIQGLTERNSQLENAFLTGNLSSLQEACDYIAQSTTGTTLKNMSASWSGTQQQIDTPPMTGTQNNNTGNYQSLSDETEQIINDIYQANIQYIGTMQQASQNKSYNPLLRLQQLFKEFYGDKSEFDQ